MAALNQNNQRRSSQSTHSAHSVHPPIHSSHEYTSLPETIGRRVDPQYSKTLHSRLKEILNFHLEGFPGTQPVSFESKHLAELQREDYYVCEKTDGIRYLLLFLQSPKGPASFLFDQNRVWYYVPNLLFPMRGRDKEYLKDTLLDGELVIESDENKKSWRFLAFDLMALNNVPVTKRSFNTRLGMLQQDIIAPFNSSIRHITDQNKLPPFTIELKKMERAYGLHLVFDQMTRVKHNSDGVIWTPVKWPYVPGTCDKLLKWKPPESCTADLRISATWSKEHKPIYALEVLSHGVTYKFYDHFQPEHELAASWKNNLPDGRIAEFRYDPNWEVTIVEQGYAPTTRQGGWRFVRFRDDKDTANDENEVRKVMNSIRDGITKDVLLAHMDYVRNAWKAREKGTPIPPQFPPSAKVPDPLNLAGSPARKSAQPIPSSALMTPTSATPAILPSPSTNKVNDFFAATSEAKATAAQQLEQHPKPEVDRRRSEADANLNNSRRPSLGQRNKSTDPRWSEEARPSESMDHEPSRTPPTGSDFEQKAKRRDESPPKATGAVDRKRFKSWAGEDRRPTVDYERRLSPVSETPASQKSEPVRHHQPLQRSPRHPPQQPPQPPSQQQQQQPLPVAPSQSPPPPPPPPPPAPNESLRRRKISASSPLLTTNQAESGAPKGRAFYAHHIEAHSDPSLAEKSRRTSEGAERIPVNNQPSFRVHNNGKESRAKYPPEKNGEQKPASAPAPIRQSSSSNIHSLLTTSVEPSSVLNKASPPPSQVHPQSASPALSSSEDRPVSRRPYDFATILQSRPSQTEESRNVQFINYHAEQQSSPIAPQVGDRSAMMTATAVAQAGRPDNSSNSNKPAGSWQATYSPASSASPVDGRGRQMGVWKAVVGAPAGEPAPPPHPQVHPHAPPPPPPPPPEQHQHQQQQAQPPPLPPQPHYPHHPHFQQQQHPHPHHPQPPAPLPPGSGVYSPRSRYVGNAAYESPHHPQHPQQQQPSSYPYGASYPPPTYLPPGYPPHSLSKNHPAEPPGVPPPPPPPPVTAAAGYHRYEPAKTEDDGKKRSSKNMLDFILN